MDENNTENLEKQQKKQEQNEASQKTAHVAGKAASQYLAPGVGGKIYDSASKTKAGQKIEKTAGDILQKVPGMNKIMGGLNKSGALDAADKGLDAVSANPNTGVSPNAKLPSQTPQIGNNGGSTPNSSSSSNASDNSNPNPNTNVDRNAESSSSSQANDISGSTSNSSSSSNASGIIAIIRWFMKLPSIIKMAIFYLLGILLILLAVILVLFILQSYETEVAENLYQAGEKVSNFFEEAYKNVSNIFIDIFNPDLEKKAEETQKAYYLKLQHVAEEYEKDYGVKIDTTLITATLFYERYMEDYLEKDVPGEDADDVASIASQDIKFYEAAKKYIKTLAKFQIVETTTYNACGTSEYPAQMALFPEGAKEVAENWDNIWRFGFNSRRIFNYVNAEQIIHTKADGTTTNITWCPYSDAESQISPYYKEDLSYVQTSKKNYDDCIARQTACQANAQAQFRACEAEALKEYQECEASKTPANAEKNCKKRTCTLQRCDSCTAEETTYNNANSRFETSWVESGLYVDGIFQCVSNNKFGALSTYTGDPSRYENKSFELDAIRNGDRPKNIGTINCSSNATIQYTYALDIAREGVYYHKLLSKNTTFLKNKNFIELYYELELEGYEGVKKEEKMLEIVEGIYDLYEYIADRNIFAYGNSNMCPNGVTVISGTNNSGHMLNPESYPIGTFSLEDYVAMVVNGENYSDYDESVKAQIIAARTYTLERTDGCTKSIRNSTEDQVAKANPDSRLKQLVLETAGQVLTYNGETFLSQYDSFDGTCNGSMCTAVYTKIPNGETHTVSIPTEFVTKTSDGNPLGGHGQGMSQCAANYLASQGYSYEEILKYFYSSGVQIMVGSIVNDTANSGLALSPSGIVTALASAGHTLESYSNEMFTAVRNSGLASVSAVLTVADYATSKFYNITGGQKLNYSYGGGHGTSYARYGFYSPYALDCSSFISWVLYNAGFNYKTYDSGDWGNVDPKYPISSKQGKPGDLIWFEGHIALIVASDENGYYTAEAYSPGSGIINHYYAYNYSNKAAYTVDMTQFYRENVNTANYPEGG